MHDPGVGFGGAHGNVMFPFQQANAKLIFGQFSGNQTADHPGADDCNIKLFHK